MKPPLPSFLNLNHNLNFNPILGLVLNPLNLIRIPKVTKGEMRPGRVDGQFFVGRSGDSSLDSAIALQP